MIVPLNLVVPDDTAAPAEPLAVNDRLLEPVGQAALGSGNGYHQLGSRHHVEGNGYHQPGNGYAGNGHAGNGHAGNGHGGNGHGGNGSGDDGNSYGYAENDSPAEACTRGIRPTARLSPPLVPHPAGADARATRTCPGRIRGRPLRMTTCPSGPPGEPGPPAARVGQSRGRHSGVRRASGPG